MSLKLLATVPTHSGAIQLECAQTLLGAQELVLSRGGSFRAHFLGGATISTLRNALAAEFLESDAEILLMLDADQAVWPETLGRMIDFRQPVVGCVYPKRSYDFSKVSFERATSLDELLYQASEYVGWLNTDEAGQAHLVNGFARAVQVGTGILLVRREAFHRLMEHFPELKGRGFAEDTYPQHKASGRWGFFNPLDNEDGVPLSEDISFCRRWQAAGGEIWADAVSNTMHVGAHQFIGNYADYLKANTSS